MDAQRQSVPIRLPRRGYAGPLVEPEPVTTESGIPIPPAERGGAYSVGTWSGIIRDFAWQGHHNAAVWRQVASTMANARVDTEHLLRERDLSTNAACWHAQAMGRIMGYRLKLEAKRHGRTPDGLRAAIQDTWFPATTRLQRAADTIGSLTSPSDASTRMACDRNDHLTSALLEAVVPHGQQWDVRGLRDKRQMFTDREIVWAVAVNMAANNRWTERALFLAINTGLQPAGGYITRAKPYSLVGGIPGATGCADSRPSGITWTSSDAMWALTSGITDPFWKRQHLVPDVQTAHRMALQSLVPSWATETVAPDHATERQAWHIVEQHGAFQDLPPTASTWMLEQGYLKRETPDIQGDADVLTVTDAGVERLKRIRIHGV